jgi:hypothetical protein
LVEVASSHASLPAAGPVPARAALAPLVNSIIGVLPAAELRTTAFLAVLHDQVTRGSRDAMTTVTVAATELISIDAIASVGTVAWWCRICDHYDTASTRPAAHSDGVAHLATEHQATISTAP